MPQIEDSTEAPASNLVRKHIWFDADDWNWIAATFGGKIGTSAAVRLMVKKFRENVEARAADAATRPKVER